MRTVSVSSAVVDVFSRKNQLEIDIPTLNDKMLKSAHGEQFCLDFFRSPQNFFVGETSLLNYIESKNIECKDNKEKLAISKTWIIESLIQNNNPITNIITFTDAINSIQKFHSQVTMGAAGFLIFSLFLNTLKIDLEDYNHPIEFKENRKVTLYSKNKKSFYQVIGEITIANTDPKVSLGIALCDFEVTNIGFKLVNMGYENPFLRALLEANIPDTKNDAAAGMTAFTLEKFYTEFECQLNSFFKTPFERLLRNDTDKFLLDKTKYLIDRFLLLMQSWGDSNSDITKAFNQTVYKLCKTQLLDRAEKRENRKLSEDNINTLEALVNLLNLSDTSLRSKKNLKTEQALIAKVYEKTLKSLTPLFSSPEPNSIQEKASLTAFFNVQHEKIKQLLHYAIPDADKFALVEGLKEIAHQLNLESSGNHPDFNMARTFSVFKIETVVPMSLPISPK